MALWHFLWGEGGGRTELFLRVSLNRWWNGTRNGANTPDQSMRRQCLKVIQGYPQGWFQKSTVAGVPILAPTPLLPPSCHRPLEIQAIALCRFILIDLLTVWYVCSLVGNDAGASLVWGNSVSLMPSDAVHTLFVNTSFFVTCMAPQSSLIVWTKGSTQEINHNSGT